MSTSKPRILGISGSLRRASFNTAVLATLAERVADRAELVLHPLNDVPPYNQDLDTDAPPASVTALRQAIAEADGLVVASPEYNYGIRTDDLKGTLAWIAKSYPEVDFTNPPVRQAP